MQKGRNRQVLNNVTPWFDLVEMLYTVSTHRLIRATRMGACRDLFSAQRKRIDGSPAPPPKSYGERESERKG